MSKIILFFLILMSREALSQNTWKFKDQQHLFILRLDTSFVLHMEGDNRGPLVKEIEIYQIKNNIKIQDIIPDQFKWQVFFDSSEIFILEDMNFDGHNDIRLLTWSSTDAKLRTYWYWFYNTKTKKFDRDIEFENFRSHIFDHQNKKIKMNYINRLGFDTLSNKCKPIY